VRPTSDGTLLGGRLAFERRLAETSGFSLGGRVSLDAGQFEHEGYAIPLAQIQLRRGSADRRSSAELRTTAGVALGSPAPQQLFLLGGRHTLPGYPYRVFGGDAFVLANLEAARDLLYPFVRARITGAAGWTGTRETEPPLSWGTAETRTVRTSAGLGLGFVYDLLRIDLARGLSRGGEWQLLVSLEPRIWPWL
jgi:hypothetical protein